MTTTEIVMSFDPNGSVEFTRNKALDAFFGGAGTMKRVTDIQKADNSASYCIKWLMGPLAHTGHPADENDGRHTLQMHMAVFGKDMVAWDCVASGWQGVLWFHSYEAAVQYEIACLNKMREQGTTFDGEAA